MKIDVDYSESTYDLYINGFLRGDDLSFERPIDGSVQAVNLCEVGHYTKNSTLIDNVEIYTYKDHVADAGLDTFYVAKTGNNEYAGTLRGITVTVKLDGDVYYITAKGKTVKVTLADGEYFVQFGEKSAVYNMDENLYKFSAGENNSVSVRRSIK